MSEDPNIEGHAPPEEEQPTRAENGEGEEPLRRSSKRRSTRRKTTRRTRTLRSSQTAELVTKIPSDRDNAVGGILWDFYARAKASSSGQSDKFKEVFKAKQDGRMEGVVFDESGGVQFISTLIDREKLHFSLLQELTDFWKKRMAAKGKTFWPRLGKEAARARAKVVLESKRLSSSLHAEVNLWVKAHREAEVVQPEHEPQETLHERQARVRCFWGEYHSCMRTREPPEAYETEEFASWGGMQGLGKNPWSSKTWQTEFHRTSSGLNRTSSGLSRTSTGLSRTSSSQALLRRSNSVGSLKSTRAVKKMTVYPRLIEVKDPLPQLVRDVRKPPWTPPRTDPDMKSRKILFRPDRNDKSLLPPLTSPDLLGKESLEKRYLRDCRAKGQIAKPVKQPPAGGPPSPARHYVLECESSGTMPTPMPFLTGHSLRFHLWDRVLVDNDLMAATVGLTNMGEVEEVDLEGNRKLTDRSLVPFLAELEGHEAIWSLQRLSLKHCVQAGRGTLDRVARLLSNNDDGAMNLRYLDLGGLSISTSVQKRLCEAVKAHAALKTVCLSDVGLGTGGPASTKECVGCLLACKSLEVLDLGWNCFPPEVFSHLGARAVENRRLQSLCLANTSEAQTRTTGGDVPIVSFLEYLASDETLSYLDISLNRMTFCGALVLEDSLGNHSKLTQLIVSNNPLGVFGLRCILRLLLRSASGLMKFTCEGCTNGPAPVEAESESQVFTGNNPGGRYDLDLDRPYHRSILRMLCKTLEHFGSTPQANFTDITFTAGPYTHPTKNEKGVWQVPETGKLSFTFSMEKIMEVELTKLSEDSPFSAVVEEHYKWTRIKPSFKKLVPFMALWRRPDGHSLDQAAVLSAMSQDFHLSYPQITQLCGSKSVTSEVICRLMHCVTGGTPARYLTMLHSQSIGEFIKNIKYVSGYMGFNVDNPTWHYKHDLVHPSERAVAEALLLLDRWEAVTARKKGRFPVSQNGNHTSVRNVTFQDRKLLVSTIDQWRMPEYGWFEFDYVSGRRPPPEAVALDEVGFNNVMSVLHQSECSHNEVVGVLRTLSSYVFWTAMQLRELLGVFQEDSQRADLFVLFCMRVVDIHNEKVFRVRFANKPEELVKLRSRLGATTLFPFIQPEQAMFSLDFAIHDERLCASMIVDLASRESPLQNMRNPSYIREDGTQDPLTTGVPRSWASFDKCPTSGVFKVQYECSPQDRSFSHRVKLMETYGFWTCKTPENDVMWWAALVEAPQDVLDFLEFLVARFPDIKTPFTVIDGGEQGNGELSLREFEDGMRNLKFNKFKGKGESQRIANIFRYLDPSGEGSVSLDEWNVLDKLWKEMRQSIREFVMFLERTFPNTGSNDVLDLAWDFIDQDGDGGIDPEEWTSIVHEGLRYFGPSSVIFRFLDKDGEGTIDYEEFRSLEVFLKENQQTPAA